MARWGFRANKGAANVTGIALAVAAAASPRRAKVSDYMVGCIASPADNVYDHRIIRCTTAGTGAAVTPVAKDPADTLASTIVCKDTLTADGTTSGVALVAFPLNARATFRWVAAPGDEIVIPATASNGIMGGLATATTVDFTASVGYEEL